VSDSSSNLVKTPLTPPIDAIANHNTALVALQAHSKPQDRAVATSTRNLLRALGSVVGMAISTAVQFAVMQSALPASLPSAVRASHRWQLGDRPARLRSMGIGHLGCEDEGHSCGVYHSSSTDWSLSSWRLFRPEHYSERGLRRRRRRSYAAESIGDARSLESK